MPVGGGAPADVGVPNGEKEELEDSLVVRKRSTGLERLSELRVERFDGVRGVKDTTDLRRIGKKRDEKLPAVAEGASDAGILRVELG